MANCCTEHVLHNYGLCGSHHVRVALLAASTNLITAYRLDFDFDFCATTETAASVVIQALRPLLNVLQTWPR